MVSHLRLHQFRCHPELEVTLGAGRNYFCGENGRGKTSVLEALYLLSRLRSFRTATPRELCAWGADRFRTEAQQDDQHLSFMWEKGERRLEWNHQPIQRLEEFWGRISTVLLAPQDRLLVSGPAAGRRQWIDALIAQCTADYVGVVQRYTRLLAQRNAALKQAALDRRVIALLAEQMTPLMKEITRRREAMSLALAGDIAVAFQDILGGAPPVTWLYQPHLPVDDAPDWEKVQAQEFSQRMTLLGPQRDEWKFAWGGHSLARFGSEGQQRIAAVSLRLAEARRIREARGGWPVFLIDDVANTLDPDRRQRFMTAIPNEAQALIALPETQCPLVARAEDQVWRVEPGKLVGM